MDREKEKYKLSLLHKSNSEKFSINGSWVFSDKELGNQKAFLFGQLNHFVDENFVRIYNDFADQHIAYETLPGSSQKRDLFGYIENTSGTFILMPNATYYPNPLNCVVNCFSDTYYRDYFLVTNYNPMHQMKFNHITFDFACLDTISDPIRMMDLYDENQVQLVSKPKIFLGNINTCTKLELSELASRKMKKRGLKIAFTITPLLDIESDKFFSVEQALKICRRLQDYLTLITSKYTNNKLIELWKKPPFICKKNVKNVKCDIYYEQLKELGKRFSFKAIKFNRFNVRSTVSKWFQLIESDCPFILLVNNYLQNLKYKTTIEDQLITLTQGIDSFFVGKHIQECMAENVPLKKRYTLLDKLQLLYQSLPTDFKNKLNEIISPMDINKWLERLKDKRVNITHG